VRGDDTFHGEIRACAGGDCGAVLEGAPTTRAPAIGLTDTGDFGGSITATLAQVNPVKAAPIVGASEESAISVTIEISNGSAGRSAWTASP